MRIVKQGRVGKNDQLDGHVKFDGSVEGQIHKPRYNVAFSIVPQRAIGVF